MDRGAWQLQSMLSQRVRHDCASAHSTWRRAVRMGSVGVTESGFTHRGLHAGRVAGVLGRGAENRKGL